MKAICFNFKNGVITERVGEVYKINCSRSKFVKVEYEIDEELGMHKPAIVGSPVFVSSKEGVIHNNFIWYPIDKFDVETENQLVIEAAKAFRDKTNMKIHEMEKEMDKLFQAERYLNDIIR